MKIAMHPLHPRPIGETGTVGREDDSRSVREEQHSCCRHPMGSVLLSIIVALATLADHSHLLAASFDPQNVLDSGIQPETVERRSYLEYVRECVDLLEEPGKHRLGISCRATHAFDEPLVPELFALRVHRFRDAVAEDHQEIPWRQMQGLFFKLRIVKQPHNESTGVEPALSR